MIQAVIVGGEGNGKKALVLPQGELLVNNYFCPPLLPQMCKVFRQYLTITGLPAGSNDMGVDGSVNPVLFWIPANADNDRYITTLSFLVGYGAAGALYEWADSGGALANGIRFYYERQGEEVDIHDAIQTNSDLIRLSDMGIVPTAWELRNLGALNDYGYLITVCLSCMIPPHGIKLDRGSTQKLLIEIRDDARDADTFNAIAYGFDRFE